MSVVVFRNPRAIFVRTCVIIKRVEFRSADCFAVMPSSSCAGLVEGGMRCTRRDEERGGRGRVWRGKAYQGMRDEEEEGATREGQPCSKPTQSSNPHDDPAGVSANLTEPKCHFPTACAEYPRFRNSLGSVFVPFGNRNGAGPIKIPPEPNPDMWEYFPVKKAMREGVHTVWT
jgi:hypothetical protein